MAKRTFEVDEETRLMRERIEQAGFKLRQLTMDELENLSLNDLWPDNPERPSFWYVYLNASQLEILEKLRKGGFV